MLLAQIIIGTLAALGIGIGVFVAWNQQRKADAAWTPGTAGSIAFTWRAEPGSGTDPTVLAHQVDRAVLAIVTHGPWSAQAVTQALWGVKVQIRAVEAWDTPEGRSAGQQYPGLVIVGASLAALPHEFAHILRQVIDHADDAAELRHEGWDALGLNAAIAEYQAAA